jgi:hypothetical protein
MSHRPQLECDVHDLLDEANVMLLMHAEASPVADELIQRLRHCAERASATGRPDIAERLNRAADMLDTKLKAATRV